MILGLCYNFRLQYATPTLPMTTPILIATPQLQYKVNSNVSIKQLPLMLVLVFSCGYSCIFVLQIDLARGSKTVI